MTAEDMTLGEVARTVGRIEDQVTEVRRKVDEQAQQYVTRREFDQHVAASKESVDKLAGLVTTGFAEMKAAQERQTAQAAQAAAASRVPWPAIVAAICAVVAVAVTLIQHIAN